MASTHTAGFGPGHPCARSGARRTLRSTERFVTRRALAALLGIAAASASLAASARAVQTGPAPGETVAILELAAPTATEFTLRGTIPVPPGTFPRADRRSPFSVVDSDGSIVPAQTEHVTWYPDLAQGADVVEVLARVHRPGAAQPNTRISYAVVATPCDDSRPVLTAAAQQILDGYKVLTLRTRDVFDNLYEVDLRLGSLHREALRWGPHALTMRYYGMLKPMPPVTGPTATLPHMMGVHSYVTYWTGEDVMTIDLRIHNGASGLDGNDPIDDAQKQMYFKSLDVMTPNGWILEQDFEDPMFGGTYVSGTYTGHYLVKASADLKPHVMPQQGQMLRRIAIAPPGNDARARALLEQEGLGFCRAGTNAQGHALWSWWNASTARYFPQRMRLPQYDHLGTNYVRNDLHGDLATYGGALTSGASLNQYPIHSAMLGWAHPWGVKYGGMTSGSEIFLYDGVPTAYAASVDGYRYAMVQHRMYNDRQPTALYNKDGRPSSYLDWVVHGPAFDYVPCLFYNRLLSGYDMFGFDVAPSHHVNYVTLSGLTPSYEEALTDHDPIDLQHLIRYTHAPKVLAWLGNDAIAKDDLLMQAEIARFSYHELPTAASGAAIVSGMLTDIVSVTNHPGIGFQFGRANAWEIDTVLCAYSFGDPAWRANARPWLDQIVNMIRSGQAGCTGVIQSNQGTKLLNNQYKARQSIEQAMIEHALWGMIETVYRGVDAPRVAQLQGILTDSLYSMVGFPGWSASLDKPWAIVAVGPLDITQPLFCTTLPPNGTSSGGDGYQTWSSFAYGYRLTGDTLFLQRALEMDGAHANLYAAMHDGGLGVNVENKAALASLSESVQYP